MNIVIEVFAFVGLLVTIRKIWHFLRICWICRRAKGSGFSNGDKVIIEGTENYNGPAAVERSRWADEMNIHRKGKANGR